jgi:sugar O-acyltransferase (sialic acid O-acetyltransferase NeuD family)
MKVVVVGAGGHARSLIEALRSGGGELEPVACTDPDQSRHGTTLDGVLVIGDDRELPRLLADGVRGACVGVGGTRDNGPREQLYDELRARGFQLPAVVHSSAVVAVSASLGGGAQVLAGAIVGAGAVVGENVIVNSGAIVEHDCWIDDHVHLATGCALGGGVSVRRAAHVGIAACVLQGLTVGERAVIGGGAVVIDDVPAGHLAVGCPASARPING